MIHVIRWVLKFILLMLLIPHMLFSMAVAVIMWDGVYLHNSGEYLNYVFKNEEIKENGF